MRIAKRGHPLFLYWCSTRSGAEDYWVVATDPETASRFFADSHGFMRSRVTCEWVLEVPRHDRACYRAPSLPSEEHLEKWGVQYNENFHVFWYQGHIFRPEAIVRKLLRTDPKSVRKLKIRG
jgi:hypothetical protein